MMTVKDFMEQAEALRDCKKTLYAKGCFGQKCTKAILNEKRKQYPSWYNQQCKYGGTWYEYLSTFAGKGYILGDCVCIWKGVLWGLRAKPSYAAPAYCSNGVPDFPIDNELRKKLTGVCKPEDAKAGMALITKDNSHFGIATGKGTVIECINSIMGVNETKLSYQGTWDIAGYLPWIDYGPVSQSSSASTSKDIRIGDKVTINPGAIAGGLASTRGVKIASRYADGKYVDTVLDIQIHCGVKEAKLKGIWSWVALSYLRKV